jgi:hypothetical protein
VISEAEPKVAQRGQRAHAGQVFVPRLGWLGADGRGPEGGEPTVIRAGADGRPGPVPADEPGPVEDAESVLDRPLGHAGEPGEVAGREHLVGTEQGEQVPIRRRQHPPARDGQSISVWLRGDLDMGSPSVRTRRIGR